MSIVLDTFFGTFLRNKNADFMGFVQAGKKCTKNDCFWCTKYERIILAYTAAQTTNVIIVSYSSSQTAAQKAVAVVKEMGGVLHNLFDFTFRIVYCGVQLILNGFLKSPEKYNYKN